MFYKMILRARDLWYASNECTVLNIVNYMETRGFLRDAQIDAVKTYLYLKIACGCKPLAHLFMNGSFNTLSLENEPLTTATREYLTNNPAAAALYQYASEKDEKGQVTAKSLAEKIKAKPQTIDYKKFFEDVFYNVTYTDYLFSLPMGAGKTYLMAAFIYLDLYFAHNEPDNPAFAHNFMLFAPSGLKSSVVPSLRTIQNFDPSWVLPEPAASEIKRLIQFEILDENKTAKKSNRIKNPNVQKLATHQPYQDLFGLVAVTNAEKVILDKLIIGKDGQISFLDDKEDAVHFANELRSTIGEIPSLAIFIDEVHHAVLDDIRLRHVVNEWALRGHLNSVLGFSGTPYLSSPQKIKIDDLIVSSSEISNIVYYYPLIDGIGNFLKRPIVKIAEIADSSEIIRRGVRAFLDTYKDLTYPGGLTAKLGIYCGSIEKLETVVWPIVSQLVAEYGLPTDCILKFHKGNKSYPQPAESQLEFDTLDQPFSKVRIVLLVQIGKEGWDCRSLTGIILSQEGDCPKNMVLQTSCRCLRQVTKGAPETALIYLNQDNAEKLAEQLQKEQHTTLDEFSNKASNPLITLNRYSRMDRLNVPPISFYQLRVQYDTIVIEKTASTEEKLSKTAQDAQVLQGRIITTDFQQQAEHTTTDLVTEEQGTEAVTFWGWLAAIAKASFHTLSLDELAKYEAILKPIYQYITYEKDGTRYFSSKFNHALVEANIRKAFCDKRTFETREEKIRQDAALLVMQHFTSSVTTTKPDQYYPDQKQVEKIIKDDRGQLEIPEDAKKAIALLEGLGQHEQARLLQSQYASIPQKDRSYHYLPYRTDSGLEKIFLEGVLQLSDLADKGLEVYYNGDGYLTEFHITCYEKASNRWNYVGQYTPDFLIIKRKNGQIHQAIIVETKGSLYARDPVFQKKRRFTEDVFTAMNNDLFGYKRFDYLYIEDTMSDLEWQTKVKQKIDLFFTQEEA